MNILEMMKQAGQMQARMQELQAKVALIEATGVSGGGLVTVTVTGKGQTQSISIDPSLIVPEEAGVLEDLIRAAANDARAKADAMAQEELEKLTEGLNLPPGFKLPGL
ncbi:MAG: YbaB/EbfC family nucleoid-associated protein [Rhodospirillales bacterium]